jgi:hypothetical protein
MAVAANLHLVSASISEGPTANFGHAVGPCRQEHFPLALVQGLLYRRKINQTLSMRSAIATLPEGRIR